MEGAQRGIPIFKDVARVSAAYLYIPDVYTALFHTVDIRNSKCGVLGVIIKAGNRNWLISGPRNMHAAAPLLTALGLGGRTYFCNSRN